MRLLRIEANGEFSLIEREGRNIPRYAILSHTWGKDEEEVTFKDLTNRTGQTKIGYRKLRFCAKQATQDALNYFWVDTCCIDKSSSADLSEAINSMFRWYQNADKCYVYLSDVSVSASDSKEQLLSASRWLTRGWTLQELLASQSVNFFSSEGCLLGSKSSLIQELAATTGIPVEALLGESLSHFSVQERLSWAERRDTKREEDAAYCLLGIFGIQIPPMYGEGRQNAMRRLLKEIKSGIGLDDILKWLDPPEFATVYHESIVEREGNTGQWIFGHPFFRDWLQKESVDKTLGRIRWIHGHPGGGKTTLAASVIQHLSSAQHDAPSAPNAYYFFFRHDMPSHTMPISAYRSILSQFIQRHSNRQDIVQEFHTTIDHARKSVGQPVSSEPELLGLLQKSLNSLQCSYIILDGVDECSNIKSLVKVIDQLGNIPTVRILIFSRPNTHDLVRLIQEDYRLPFGQQEVENDIRIYLRRSIEAMVREGRLHLNANINKYVQHLATGANKMFLWAKLMVSFLQSPIFTRAMIEQMIWNITLPEGLEAMYDRIFEIMSKAPVHQQKQATRILSWMLNSRRELSIEDLQTVIAPITNDMNAIGEIWPNFAEVVSMITCGLVTYSTWNKSTSFRLIHISVAEYIDGWKLSQSKPSADDLLRPAKATANLELATTSLKLLLRASWQKQQSNVLGAVVLEQPMISYAAKFWITHLGSSITQSLDSLWDVERLHTMLEEARVSLSDLLQSPEAVAFYVEVFHRVQRLELGPFYNQTQTQGLETYLEGEIRAILEWVDWAQTLASLALSSNFLSTLNTLRDFCSDMATFTKQWGHKLMDDPSLIYRDALVFNSSRFLPGGKRTKTTYFPPRANKTTGVSSRPLCHISATSKDTKVLGVLSVWPSERYEKFWRDLDPYAAYAQVEGFCIGWTAHYELWSTMDPGRVIFSATLPLEAAEVALQMRQAFRHEYGAAWKTSFPTTISPDGLTVCILRTLYLFSLSSLNSEPTWKTTVLPLDSMDRFRKRWDPNLGIFDPKDPSIVNLPTGLRLLFRDWYTYTVTFSSDCRYLLFSDHQEPFCRNLVLFEDMDDRSTGPRMVSLVTLNIPKTELRFVTFHSEEPIVAFVCAQSVWIWKYRAVGSTSLSMIYPRSSSTGHSTSNISYDSDVIATCFSPCGKYISVTLEHGSVVVPLGMQDLIANSEDAGPSQCLPAIHFGGSNRRPRPEAMSLAAILCPEVPQDNIVLSHGIQNNQLEQGRNLDITPHGKLSARTSRLVGCDLVEERAHLLELPSNVSSTQAVVRHDRTVRAGHEKISVILNQTSNVAYDMNEPNTSIFPAMVEMEYASVRKTLSIQPLHKSRDSGTESLLKRAIECGGTFERETKVRREIESFRADLHNDDDDTLWPER